MDSDITTAAELVKKLTLKAAQAPRTESSQLMLLAADYISQIISSQQPAQE